VSYRSVGSGRCTDSLEPATVVLWWHVLRSNCGMTWMIELRVQTTMTKWSAGGVSVWRRRHTTSTPLPHRLHQYFDHARRPVVGTRNMLPQHNGGGLQAARATTRSHRPMTKWSAGETKSSVRQRPVSQSRRKSKVSQKSSQSVSRKCPGGHK